MQDPPTVGVGDGVADCHEPGDQLSERNSLRMSTSQTFILMVIGDRLGEGAGSQPPHRETRAVDCRDRSESIHRNDPRMFQFPGHLNLEEEPPLSCLGIVISHAFDSDWTVKLGVEASVNAALTTANWLTPILFTNLHPLKRREGIADRKSQASAVSYGCSGLSQGGVVGVWSVGR
jgi:hypothetical protein